MSKQLNVRPGERTMQQVTDLAALYHDSVTAVVRIAVDRMYQQEVATMSDQVIRSFREGNGISDNDLWDQFCGDMTHEEILAQYEGPDELDVHGTGWTATPEIAAYVEKRLWNLALDTLDDASILTARGAALTIDTDRDGNLVWCLSGVNRDGNGWETDDYEADSQDAAHEAAAEYLREYLRADA